MVPVVVRSRRTPEKRNPRSMFFLQMTRFIGARSAGLEPATFSVRSWTWRMPAGVAYVHEPLCQAKSLLFAEVRSSPNAGKCQLCWHQCWHQTEYTLRVSPTSLRSFSCFHSSSLSEHSRRASVRETSSYWGRLMLPKLAASGTATIYSDQP